MPKDTTARRLAEALDMGRHTPRSRAPFVETTIRYTGPSRSLAVGTLTHVHQEEERCQANSCTWRSTRRTPTAHGVLERRLRLGGRASDVTGDGLPDVPHRRGSGRRDRRRPGPGRPPHRLLRHRGHRRDHRQGARARRRGRGASCRCRATAGSPAARTPKGTRSASGRATSLRRSRGVRLDQTTAGGSSSRRTFCDGSGEPSFSSASCCSFIRSLNARPRAAVTSHDDRERAAPSPRCAGSFRAGRLDLRGQPEHAV